MLLRGGVGEHLGRVIGGRNNDDDAGSQFFTGNAEGVFHGMCYNIHKVGGGSVQNITLIHPSHELTTVQNEFAVVRN